MTTTLTKSFLNLLSKIFVYEVGTVQFYTVCAATFVGWILVARLLAGVCGSKRGIFATTSAIAVPLILGAFTYALVEVYALPSIRTEWASAYLPWIGFGLAILLALRFFARRILEIDTGVILFVFLLSAGAAFGVFYGTRLILELTGKGSSKIEQHEDQLLEGVEIE